MSGLTIGCEIESKSLKDKVPLKLFKKKNESDTCVMLQMV